MEVLTKCKCGIYRKVVSIHSASPLKIKRRLLELGFTRGENIKIMRKSLLGNTFLIEIRGYCISLRKKIAEYIMVE